MKVFYTVFAILFSCMNVCAKVTNITDRAPKSTTSSSRKNDDPGKILAICMKYGKLDTFYIKINGAECPNYIYSSTTINLSSPYFHLLGVGGAIDTATYQPISITPSSSYLLPFYCKVDSIPNSSVYPQGLVMLTLNMVAPNNAAIECSRTKISVNIYLSELGCAGEDTTFSTGKCYTCKTNNLNQFPLSTFAHFSWTTSGTMMTFTNQSVYQAGDTLIFYYGDGDSTFMIPASYTSGLIIGQHTYPSYGTYRPSLVIKCKQNKGECVYRANARIILEGPLEANSTVLTLTSNLIDNSNGVQLYWTLLAMMNLHHYEIERREQSAVVGPWAVIGKTNELAFIDRDIMYGKTYQYRITAVDVNGAKQFHSNENSVEINSETKVSPNPTKDKITIRADIHEKETPTYLYDMNGHLLQQWTEIPDEVDLSYLPSGIYCLKIGMKTMRVVKR